MRALFQSVIDDEVEVGVQRDGDVVLICGRCRPEPVDGWVRQVRQQVYARVGPQAVTVTVSGCVRTCPAGQVAVVLAGSGCREWAVTPDGDGARKLVDGLVFVAT
ncbi:hypothetical protein [Fodinicola acaciae]|uniref:hypothetical protein n=1 Tax=Fodinicola acaciae TaxID=2681555 RepID=UPI0013D16218|nr:hypothetical protein [Fodinicola acaciae]